MDPRVALLSEQFTVGTNMFQTAIAGVDGDALWRRPGPHSNPMVWIAGHLTQFRCRAVRAMGGDRPVPWEDLFRTGSTLHQPDAYPRIGEIAALWKDVSGELVDRFGRLTPAELDAPPVFRAPSTDGTLAGALVLFAFHEGYHVGQLGYLRKWLGYSSPYGA
jgi:hypothetical protein